MWDAVDLEVRERTVNLPSMLVVAGLSVATGTSLATAVVKSTAEGRDRGDGQVAFRSQKALSGKLQGLGQRSEFRMPPRKTALRNFGARLSVWL
jgi:hypothetical protein